MKETEVTDKKLVYIAYEARKKAYAPYSKFAVGVALLTESGKIFKGANVENASLGLTICAERAAVVSAITAGEQKFKAIAIFAEKLVPPCGACMQVISEFAPNIRIIACGKDGNAKATTLKKLLPKAFKKDYL